MCHTLSNKVWHCRNVTPASLQVNYVADQKDWTSWWPDLKTDKWSSSLLVRLPRIRFVRSTNLQCSFVLCLICPPRRAYRNVTQLPRHSNILHRIEFQSIWKKWSRYQSIWCKLQLLEINELATTTGQFYFWTHLPADPRAQNIPTSCGRHLDILTTDYKIMHTKGTLKHTLKLLFLAATNFSVFFGEDLATI